MKAMLEDVIGKLDNADKEKVLIFTEELLQSKKYRRLRQELDERRDEILNGKTLNHKDLWDGI
jgi:2-phospho-L-lactate guanylyltransferase (CobY/MobA/RfbA family)